MIICVLAYFKCVNNEKQSRILECILWREDLTCLMEFSYMFFLAYVPTFKREILFGKILQGFISIFLIIAHPLQRLISRLQRLFSHFNLDDFLVKIQSLFHSGGPVHTFKGKLAPWFPGFVLFGWSWFLSMKVVTGNNMRYLQEKLGMVAKCYM